MQTRHSRPALVLTLCTAFFVCAGALQDVHEASKKGHDVAYVGVSHARGADCSLDGLCALGNTLDLRGGVHGLMYALVRHPASPEQVRRLKGVHCAWNHVWADVSSVEAALARIAEQHERVIVLTDNMYIIGSLAPLATCEGRCAVAGARSFAVRDEGAPAWPASPDDARTDYGLVWSVRHNGTSLTRAREANASVVHFDTDALWMPWHWQSGSLDGVYAEWRRRVPRQDPGTTLFFLLFVHALGVLMVSPDTFRADSVLLGRRSGGIEGMSRTERACSMFFWSYFSTGEGVAPDAARPELTVREALIVLVMSFLHVSTALCYLWFGWVQGLALIQYDAAFTLLIMGCGAWGAGLSLVLIRAAGFVHTSAIHFWRFYFGFASVACVYPGMLKLLTGTSWFDYYSFSPTYALSAAVCLVPLWTAVTSLIQLDHILSITRA